MLKALTILAAVLFAMAQPARTAASAPKGTIDLALIMYSLLIRKRVFIKSSAIGSKSHS